LSTNKKQYFLSIEPQRIQSRLFLLFWQKLLLYLLFKPKQMSGLQQNFSLANALEAGIAVGIGVEAGAK
jgi:hypothetical protein